MKKLCKKLKGKGGASIVIALVFFLLCLTVGSIVLTAATASAGRMKEQRRRQQDYLTVSSAAELLRDQMAGLTYEITTETIDGGLPQRTYAAPDAPLAATMAEDAKTVYEGFPSSPAARSFTLAADGLETVQAGFSMDESYVVTVTLYLADEEDARRCHMFFTVPAVTEERTEYETWDEVVEGVNENGEPTQELVPHEKLTEIFTVTWDKGEIRKGEPA